MPIRSLRSHPASRRPRARPDTRAQTSPYLSRRSPWTSASLSGSRAALARSMWWTRKSTLAAARPIAARARQLPVDKAGDARDGGEALGHELLVVDRDAELALDEGHDLQDAQ